MQSEGTSFQFGSQPFSGRDAERPVRRTATTLSKTGHGLSQMERGAASRQRRVSGCRRNREETKSSPLAPREERDCPPNRDAVNFRALPVLSRSEKTTLVSSRLHELWQKKFLKASGFLARPGAARKLVPLGKASAPSHLNCGVEATGFTLETPPSRK